MKVYTIGRDLGCDIVINDSTDVISRRHATLNVASNGKMTIVDSSHNGTYVNGIRISQNVPVPVTRKDSISFAHVAQLNWNMVPKSGVDYIKYVLMGLAALLILVLGIWGVRVLINSGDKGENTNPEPPRRESIDSAKLDAKIRAEEKRKQDSIAKHLTDSIDKARKKVKAKINDQATKDNHNKGNKKGAIKGTKPNLPEKKEPAAPANPREGRF